MDVVDRRRPGRVNARLLAARRDHALDPGMPAQAFLPAELELVEAAGERSAHHFGQPGDRGQHLERIAMHEHDPRIGIDGADGIEREHVVRALQHPPARARRRACRPGLSLGGGSLVLQVLEEPPVEPVGVEMAVPVQPVAIGGHLVDGVEPQAGEHMGGDFGTFLRRGRVERMQAGELGREPAEGRQLPVDGPDPAVAAGRRVGTGKDRLPDARHVVGRVLHQQGVQEGGAGPRQAGDEDRLHDRLVGDRGRGELGCPQAQQVAQEAVDVPARGDPPDHAEVALGGATARKCRSGSMKPSSPKSESPVVRRASPIIASAENGRSSHPNAPAAALAAPGYAILQSHQQLLPTCPLGATSQTTGRRIPRTP